MTSLGIMTLSRGPYNELDKMSLFQDLKLKRRKVDSRCSSDGESVADTSTSSPDLAPALSPKMCDQQPPTPNQVNSGCISPEDQMTSLNNNSDSNRCSSNDSNNNSDNNNEEAISKRISSQQEATLAGSKILASALTKDTIGETNGNGSGKGAEDSTHPYGRSTAVDLNKNHHANGGGGGGGAGGGNSNHNQSVIRSVKSERATNPNPPTNSPPPASRSSPSRPPSANNNHHHQLHSQQQHHSAAPHNHQSAINHSNSTSSSSSSSLHHLPSSNAAGSGGGGGGGGGGPNQSPNYNHHHMQRGSPLSGPPPPQSQGNSHNPSHQHVTVLVNPNRVKAEQQQQQQQPPPPQQPMIQHHQTTIVGIRRNSPPANNSSHGPPPPQPHQVTFSQQQQQQLSNHFRDSMGNSSGGGGGGQSFSSVMMQAMSPQNQVQLHLLHNSSSLRGASQMSPNSPSSPAPTNNGGGNSNGPNGGSPSAHNLLAAAAQGQLQIPLQLLQQQQQMRIKRERSPIHGMQGAVGGSSITLSPTHHNKLQAQQQQQQQQQQSPQMNSMPMMNPNLQMRHPMRDAAILLRVKNELPNLAQAQQRMVWNANARINGVKPEIIGGPMPNMRPNGSNAASPPQSMSQTPPRATPTVIMGESCGVRTMVWGFEPSPQMPPSPASSSSNQSSAGPTQNEEAAQLLLSLGQAGNRPNDIRPRAPVQRSPHPLNMERLWAGDYSQLPAGQQLHALNLSQPQWMGGGGGGGGAGGGGGPLANKSDQSHSEVPQDDDDQPLVCMICEDKATGLHYGIITCEGCKGFFKRTVQNRRVYTCVADGTCEITKAQRNRCQYCRFKKCIEQGMVLQAVREDRMPGGRNSGAVYNLYKVKYKKHKKVSGQKAGQSPQQNTQMPSPQHQMHAHMTGKLGGDGCDAKSAASMFLNQAQTRIKPPSSVDSNSNHSTSSSNSSSLPPHLMNGTILKTALTNPSEIVHLRHRLDNAVSSSKDRSVNYEHALCMIQTLIDCDEMENIATLPHFPEFLEDKSEIGDKLCNIGDSIVHKLVSWTKKLPFYLEIPVEIHTKLLTDKWHELLVLTTAAYQALHGKRAAAAAAESNANSGKAIIGPIVPEKGDPEFVQEVTNHLCTLQTCLTTLMGQPISMEQLRLDVGHMVEKMTQITIMFRRIKLKMEEYVCLKVYILLHKEVELESIQERYVQVLRSFLQNSSPHNPGRLNDLLAHIPEIQAAASLLLESKMFYVPFVLNSASIR